MWYKLIILFILSFHSGFIVLIFLELRKKTQITSNFAPSQIPISAPPAPPAPSQTAQSTFKSDIPLPDPLNILKKHKASGFGVTNEKDSS